MTTKIEGFDDGFVGGILAQTIFNLTSAEGGLGGLPMWVIYDKPLDFPNSIVARLHVVRDGKVNAATHRCVVSNSIAPLRVAFEKLGLVCMGRDPSDEPQIVETWL